MQLVLIFGIAVAIGAVVFALQNNAPVAVTLAMWRFEGSLAIVLLLALGLGALITGLLSSPSVIGAKWNLARLRRQVTALERDLADCRRHNGELAAELARQGVDSTAEPRAEKPYVGLRALLSGTDAAPPPADTPLLRDQKHQ